MLSTLAAGDAPSFPANSGTLRCSLSLLSPDSHMDFRRGRFLGSRKGVGLAVVVIAMLFALLVVLIWFGSRSTQDSGRQLKGGDWQNFLNWVSSPQGQVFGAVLAVAMVPLFLFFVGRVLGRKPGGGKTEWAVTRFRQAVAENSAPDETSPQTKNRD